jgi:hypothetical protein
MHLSTGQIIFALLTLTSFAVVLFFSYRRDSFIHKIHYKGAWKVLVAIIAVFLLYYILVHVLN